MRFSLVDANDGGQRPDRVVAGRRWSPHEIEGAGFRPCDGESRPATSGRRFPPTPGHEPHDREFPVSPAAAPASDPGDSRVGFGLGGNCRRRRLVHGFRNPATRYPLPAFAGTCCAEWIPACAGMTALCGGFRYPLLAPRFRGHVLRRHRPHENDGEWRPVHVPSFPRKRESTCSGAGPSSALPLPRP